MGANSALIFGIIINVAILLVFFRFLMQLAAVSPYNPVVLSTVKATKIVDVFSRIFPTVANGRVNLAALALVLALLAVDSIVPTLVVRLDTLVLVVFNELIVA